MFPITVDHAIMALCFNGITAVSKQTSPHYFHNACIEDKKMSTKTQSLIGTH